MTFQDGTIRIGFSLDGRHRRETYRVNGVAQPPTPKNVTLARQVARQVRQHIAAGTFIYAEWFPHSKHAAKGDGAMTFGDACDQWLKSKGTLAHGTKTKYRLSIEFWKRLLGQDQPITGMKHGKMAAKIGSYPWPSAKVMNNHLIALRGVFKLAGRDIKFDDPTAGITNAKHQKPAPDPLTAAERDAVLADLRKHYDVRVWAYFAFAFATGLRPEEQIALQWLDIDTRTATARIERARTFGRTGPIKTYNTRDIELTSRALEALDAMKVWTMFRQGEVFENPVTGRAWHDERSQRDHYWTPSLRRLGIRHRRAYNTRHTFATAALMGGVNPAYISRQLGHRNAKMLFTVYAKWIDAADGGRERGKLEASQTKPHEKTGT